MKKFSVAIDGPSAAGKSTAAKALAAEFGIVYVDTGAMYRAIGLYAKDNGANPSSPGEVVPLLPEIDIALNFDERGQRIILNGRDVSEEIRHHEISGYASAVSAIPEVRGFLLDLQREIASTSSVVMDGRDIGTVILPEADVKIFLTASPEVRAKRRHDELVARGESVEYNTILIDIMERDKNDSGRKTAPLRPAEDAITVDTTGLGLDESVGVVAGIIRERLGLLE